MSIRSSLAPTTTSLLDAHYIAGDGRVNENIGLTAVHAIFHSEHNRLVEHTKDVLLRLCPISEAQLRSLSSTDIWIQLIS